MVVEVIVRRKSAKEDAQERGALKLPIPADDENRRVQLAPRWVLCRIGPSVAGATLHVR